MWQSVSQTINALLSGDGTLTQFNDAAERIQSALLKVNIPSVPGLDVGVRAEPARLVGGDYIDVFYRGQHVLFGLGDASGKSLGAAINALMLRYLLRGLVQVLGHEAVGSILSHANSVVAEDLNETDYFITLLLGTMHAESGQLKIANAGHEPPLILRKDAIEVEMLTTHGIVLGVNPHSSYHVQETTLERGDRIVVYTDGLTEATNEKGELYTIECLRENILAHRNLGSQALADELFDAVRTYSNHDMRDDATILVMHRTE